MQRIPFDLAAEYVGRVPAREFARDGQVIPVPPRLKFLADVDEHDVSLLEISGTALDRVVPPFDHSALQRGDRVRLRGVCVIQERGSDKDSYVQVTSALRAKVAPVAKAS